MSRRNKIQRNTSPVPLYYTVKESILNSLAGIYEVGSKIPTEMELAKSYGVHRGTIRKAMDILVNEGFIVRERRRGTFVLKKASANPQSGGLDKAGACNIALCFPGTGKTIVLNDFYGEILQGIIQGAGNEANIVVFHIDEGSDFFPSISRRMQDSKIEGMILLGSFSDGTIAKFKTLPVAIVLGDCYISDGSLECVVSDNFRGAFEATSHLIRLGHTEIGILAGPESDKSSMERLEGASVALASSGHPLDRRLLRHARNMATDGGFDAMASLLEDSPQGMTAIFAANDSLAIGAMDAMRKSGVSVPSDVSVVGFDDVPGASSSVPPLTTMRVSKLNMGLTVAQRMLHRLKHPNMDAERIVLPPKFIERGSCASPGRRRR